MTNPKHETRNSKQVRSSKFQMVLGLRGSVLECGGMTPLSLGARFEAHGRAGCPQPAANSPRHTSARNGVRALPALLLLLCCCHLPSAFCLRAWGQSYSIDWWTIDGGGGTSTGGLYTVSGTIGQPDAGPVMTGGVYSVQGGFWGVVAAVQTPGAPYLTVARTATNTVVVSWPLADSAGWVLQATTNLVGGGSVWVTIPPPYRTNGPSIEYIELYPVGNKFYRLHKP